MATVSDVTPTQPADDHDGHDDPIVMLRWGCLLSAAFWAIVAAILML